MELVITFHQLHFLLSLARFLATDFYMEHFLFKFVIKSFKNSEWKIHASIDQNLPIVILFKLSSLQPAPNASHLPQK